MLLSAFAFPAAAFGFSALTVGMAQAQTSPTIAPPPPPLSHQTALYYKDHPTELAALLARLASQSAATAPAEAAPAGAATVGGTWTPLKHAFPGNGAGAPHLMMDGTLLVHDYCTTQWYKLTPDDTGSYVNGTWSKIAPMPAGYTPLYFASQVLADGRLIMNGGEYNTNCADAWTNRGAIYTPSTNTWASVPAPSGWTEIGDAQSVVLVNKDYMLANCCAKAEALLNPSTMQWTTTGTGKADVNDEEGWSLLPNGDVVTADAYVFTGTCGRNTELYNAATGAWKSEGNAPVQLSDCSGGNPSYEVGPEVLRPDGTVVMFSGEGQGVVAGTTVWNSTTGKFVKGPNVPTISKQDYTLADAPAALEPNGKILFAASPGNPVFSAPTLFFEYSTINLIAQITNDPPNAHAEGSYVINLLVLPTGQILQTDLSGLIELYNPVGAANAVWAPSITSLPTTIKRGTTYTVAGKQLNGLSEAGAYGDDNQSATDYPLVRISNNATGKVYYCRTASQSSRNIAPNAGTTATFVCPTSLPTGASKLVVVTNGIASPVKAVTLQ